MAENLTEFEIHFAAQAQGISPELKSKLYAMGFKDDGLLGQGATFDPQTSIHYLACPLIDVHVTWDCHDRSSYLQKKKEFDSLIESYQDDCVGYSHAEIIKPEWDVDIEHMPFSSEVLLPIKHFHPVPSRAPKKWDIHVSAYLDKLDTELENELFLKAGMYFIDVRKKNDRIARVFTIQGTNSVQEGYQLFQSLTEYLRKAGGMQGAIKFEQTISWGLYGNPQIVPPVIDRIEYLI